MTRYIITINDQKIGQAGSWHKALDVLIRQTGMMRMTITIINRDFVKVSNDNTEYDEVYSIKKEAI